jgi:DNA-binding PadR family transcriptional regulator
MYRDKTLIPTEAIRLAALGTLALQPMSYANLAREVRAFTSRIAGPSLDMMGTSIELLRTESLVAPLEGSAAGPDTVLTLTPEGHAEFHELMTSNVRSPLDGVSKLVFALKLRFLHLLPADDARAQRDLMAEISAGERARLIDLKQRHAGEPGHFAGWLDGEIDALDQRIAWLAAIDFGD